MSDLAVGLSVAAGVTILLILSISLYRLRCSSRARFVANQLNIEKLDIPLNASRSEIRSRLQQGFATHLKKRAEERLALENSTSFGEPMWLSLYAKRGPLKHWAILIHGQKYELREHRPATKTEKHTPRRKRSDVHRDPIPDVCGKSGFGRYYEQMIREEPLYSHIVKDRDKAIKAKREPMVGVFYIVHIGWTRKTKEEVNAESQKVWETFGNYNLLGNNCQHFVQQLATRVVTKKSEDWNWFLNAPLSTYRYVGPETIHAPGGVAVRCIERLKELRDHGGITDPVVLMSIDAQIKSLEGYVRSLQPNFQQFNIQMQQTQMSNEQYGDGCCGSDCGGECGCCDGGDGSGCCDDGDGSGCCDGDGGCGGCDGGGDGGGGGGDGGGGGGG